GRLLRDARGGPGARHRPPAGVLGGMEGAEAPLARAGEGFVGEDALGVPAGGVRRQLALGEVTSGLGKGALLVGQFQIHGFVSWWSASTVPRPSREPPRPPWADFA